MTRQRQRDTGQTGTERRQSRDTERQTQGETGRQEGRQTDQRGGGRGRRQFHLRRKTQCSREKLSCLIMITPVPAEQRMQIERRTRKINTKKGQNEKNNTRKSQTTRETAKDDKQKE